MIKKVKNIRTIKCWVCDEINGNVNSIGYKYRKGRFIIKTNNFIVYPAIGSFIENYLIITPIRHINTLGLLKQNEMVELEILIKIIYNYLKHNYNNYIKFNNLIIFEHGDTTKTVEHAHLNILPSNIDCITKIVQYLNNKYNIIYKTSNLDKSISHLKRKRISKYILLGYLGDHYSQFMIYYETKHINQLVRKLLCEICPVYNCKSKWNWKKYPGEYYIEKTYKLWNNDSLKFKNLKTNNNQIS